jgi:putative ABC transport system substrate-binding protein
MPRRLIALLVTLALGFLLAVPAADAQQPGKVYRIGLLFGSSQALREKHAYEAFQQSLRELGYVEGKNVILEYRSMEGNVALLPALAAELVRLNVDIIVTGAIGYVGVLAAKQGFQALSAENLRSGRGRRHHRRSPGTHTAPKNKTLYCT